MTVWRRRLLGGNDAFDAGMRRLEGRSILMRPFFGRSILIQTFCAATEGVCRFLFLKRFGAVVESTTRLRWDI